jgi:SAM-dependent methyltransferase
MSEVAAKLPNWALDVLRCPDTGAALSLVGSRVIAAGGGEIGRLEGGIVRLPIGATDDNIEVYRQLGGSHFFERASLDFAMSALDTPVYHRHLEQVQPASTDGIVVDVGGGDGRNAQRYLEKGYRRVVVADAVAEGLARFRERIAASNPEWLDRVLLIEADARCLPLKAECADAVLAVESLFYLNEDYEIGLRQCSRLLTREGKLLVSERDYEGGLLLQLLYRGVAGMLEGRGNRIIVDGQPGQLMRSRCFSEGELIRLLSDNGLAIQSVRGISLMSVVLGWMRNRQLIGQKDAVHLPAVSALLAELGQQGRLRRCHVVVAGRGA